MNAEQLQQLVSEIFVSQIPFNRFLGLEIPVFSRERVEVHLHMNEHLVGNPLQQILHGGVTASILDVAGGLTAAASMFDRLEGASIDDIKYRLGRLGTIDMRVDYLRPGHGERFVATAEVIRSGNKLAVTRMELHNEQGRHIAFGTGTYLIG